MKLEMGVKNFLLVQQVFEIETNILEAYSAKVMGDGTTFQVHK